MTTEDYRALSDSLRYVGSAFQQKGEIERQRRLDAELRLRQAEEDARRKAQEERAQRQFEETMLASKLQREQQAKQRGYYEGGFADPSVYALPRAADAPADAPTQYDTSGYLSEAGKAGITPDKAMEMFKSATAPDYKEQEKAMELKGKEQEIGLAGRELALQKNIFDFKQKQSGRPLSLSEINSTADNLIKERVGKKEERDLLKGEIEANKVKGENLYSDRTSFQRLLNLEKEIRDLDEQIALASRYRKEALSRNEMTGEAPQMRDSFEALTEPPARPTAPQAPQQSEDAIYEMQVRDLLTKSASDTPAVKARKANDLNALKQSNPALWSRVIQKIRAEQQ